MIVTRGMNSNTLVTRGYGIAVQYVKGVCLFTKALIVRTFSRSKQKTKFEKEC